MTSLEKAKNIAKILDKKKAIDIIGIETKELTVMSDYFIIASGTSNTHVRALADEVDDEMKKLGVEVDHIEGRATGWILLDYNDVLVHVFQPESRLFHKNPPLFRRTVGGCVIREALMKSCAVGS